MGVAVQAIAFFQIVAPLIVQLLQGAEEMGLPVDHAVLLLRFPLCQQVGNTDRRLAFIDQIKVQLQVPAFG